MGRGKSVDAEEKKRIKLEKEVISKREELIELRKKKREQLLNKNPDLITTYNKILENEGVMIDPSTGKYVGKDGKDGAVVKDVDFEKVGNLSRINRKYIRGATPFEERTTLVSKETKMMLGTDSDYEELKKLLESPQSRQFYDHKDNKVLTEYVSGNCTQPLQIRFMGPLDDVRDLTLKLIKDLEIEDLVFPEPGVIKPDGISFSKLECTKHNRNKSYCNNTMRVYINMSKLDERREKKIISEENKALGLKGDEKRVWQKSPDDTLTCMLKLGDKPDKMEEIGFFVDNYLDKIKNAETTNMEKIIGMIPKEKIPSNDYDEVFRIVRETAPNLEKATNPRVKSKMVEKVKEVNPKIPIIYDSIAQWTLGDIFITRTDDRKINVVKID